MKPFLHWSATQVTTYRLCARKWYLSKIVGMEQPETQALKDGKRYAEEAEFYFKSDNSNELSPVTRPLVALVAAGRIPAPRTRPGSVLRVEHPIGVDRRAVDATGAALLEVDGLPAEGYMDLLDLHPGRPVVWDQKTTKSKRYIKETEQLRTDVQMVLYAKATTLQHEAVYGCAPEAVGVAHIALLKPPESPEAIIVGPTYLDLEHIETQWQGIKNTVRDMKVVALSPGADKVTPSWTACGAFGGCSFRDTCQSLKTMSQPQGLPQMSLLSDLVAKKAAAAASPAPLATATITQTAPPLGLAARIAANLKSPGQVTPPDAPASISLAGISAGLKIAPVVPAVLNVVAPARNPAVVATEDASTKLRAPRNGDKRIGALGWDDYAISCMSIERKHAVLDGGLKPTPLGTVTDDADDAPKMRDWDLTSNEALEEGARLGWSEETMNEMSDEVFATVLTDSMSAAAWTLNADGTDLVAIVVAAAPARRTRTAKAPDASIESWKKAEEQIHEDVQRKNIDRVVAEANARMEAEREAAAVMEAPSVEKRLFGGIAALVAPVTTLTLLIGCRPSKGMQYRELGDILAPAMREIEAMKKVTYWDLLPYNEGGKLLAASVLMNPITGVVCVDPAAPYANAVLAVLLPAADVVVRA